MAHLLIVEDDLLIQRSLVRVLSREHSCVTARDGFEALWQLTRDTFDLIVSDVDMPGMNGVALYGRVMRAHPNSKFMFVTGSACLDELQALGVPVLPKAWPLRKVMHRLNAYLGVSGSHAQGKALPEVGRR